MAHETSTDPNRQPAYYCPLAKHTLRWEARIYPGQPVQGWVLRRRDRVQPRPDQIIATVEGYPPGRDPILPPAAQAWADHILDTPQQWIEQPRRSGAFHAHPDTTCPTT